MSPQSLDCKTQSSQVSTDFQPPIAYDACPGLFYPTFAKDGRLIRIRTPGGNLSSQQARVLAAVSDLFEIPARGRLGKPLQVTNRANLQIRGLPAEIPLEVLNQLQEAGLAARLSAVDHLRNIMASPTAGIDVAQLIDTTPLVKELDEYLSSHLELADLSAKFSIGVDGGEQVAIAPHNDILLRAIDLNGVHFCLYLAGIPVGIIKPEECLGAIASLAKVYLKASQDHDGVRKLRVKQLIQNIGVQELCDRAQLSLLPLPSELVPLRSQSHTHIGIHAQRQSHLSYVGISLPLGRLESWQLKGLADLVDEWGDHTLRLTPWQNLLLPNVPNAVLPQVQRQMQQLDLHYSSTHIYSGLISCAGKMCASSATDTQSDALALAEHLNKKIKLDLPITIHFSGCPKSCAHHGASDLTLVGTWIEQRQAYQIYVGENGSEIPISDRPFGRLYTEVFPEHLSSRILRILQIYQQQRTSQNQSFRTFFNQYSITQLRQWCDADQEEIK
ncbi:MAG: precorrin-3B synthase [Timaviella obliquedivisa GSE-PSE-MK23-08B]|nr:precorrin-3B synthase [Timaviella obliquedivisa GSE-PSE-MK23-08B]